jgi:hypothetical protein
MRANSRCHLHTLGAALAAVTLVLSSATIAGAQAPVAADDDYFARADGVLVVEASGVLGNDRTATDEDLPPTATAQLVADVNSGILTLFADGGFSYEPDVGFFS